jgi:hypothetical protein
MRISGDIRSLRSLQSALRGINSLTMAAQHIKTLVRTLERQITDFWEHHCFERSTNHQWLRRWGWKTDRIRVSPQGDLYLIVNFEVLIPPEREEVFDHSLVGLADLSTLAHRPSKDFRFPAFKWLFRHFVERIMSDMPLALEWFSQYNTPQGCLEHLLTPNVNPRSKAFKHCEAYLRSVPAEAANCCCLLKMDYTCPNPYSEAIFDIHHRGPLPEPKDDYYNL